MTEFAIPCSSPKPTTKRTERERVADCDSNDADRRAAESAALLPRIRIDDADLDRLNELWPMLVADDRLALLAHAEHLAAVRGGASLERATGEVSFRDPPLRDPSEAAAARNVGQ